MAQDGENPLDLLLDEYATVFRDFDDLTLARWMSQTLAQLEGRCLRLSHPLVGAYRLAAQVAHERAVWLKRLVSSPTSYREAPCCRAPLLPLLTRDVIESGLLCLHCNESAVPFDELPPDLQGLLRKWSEDYAPVHAVAHWEDDQQQRVPDYDDALEDAAEDAEELLAQAGQSMAPPLLDLFPAVIWEDQDECLEVRPEDVRV